MQSGTVEDLFLERSKICLGKRLTVLHIKYLCWSKIHSRRDQKFTVNFSVDGVGCTWRRDNAGQRCMLVQSKIHVGIGQRFATVQVKNSRPTGECRSNIYGDASQRFTAVKVKDSQSRRSKIHGGASQRFTAMQTEDSRLTKK